MHRLRSHLSHVSIASRWAGENCKVPDFIQEFVLGMFTLWYLHECIDRSSKLPVMLGLKS